MKLAEEILQQLIGCERHDYFPAGIEMPVHVYRELVSELIQPKCWNMECDHDECNRYRDAMRAKPGDNAMEFWGVKVRLVADQPKFTMLHGEVVPA